MIGTVVEREVPAVAETTTAPTTLMTTLSPNLSTVTTSPDFTNLVVKVSNSSETMSEKHIAAKKMEVAVTLAVLVGVIQVGRAL